MPRDAYYFGTVCVPFDYDHLADDLTDWLAFLRSIWPMVNGQEADEVLALQEWFGYILSGRTDLHKILFIKGPKRSGKGTVARILTALIGSCNVAGPTMGSLARNFGIQPLLGKSLAIIGDARLPYGQQSAIVEKLLMISGEDKLTVDMKYRDAWSGKLSVRFTMLSNELPKFGDESGALASRFLILTMVKSFLGEEDIELYERLLKQLPAILNWSLDGLDRLRERGRFVTPKASADAVQQLEELSSPVSAFVREACRVGVDDNGKPRVHSFDDVYVQYLVWCELNNSRPSSKQMWTRNMTTAFPCADQAPTPNPPRGWDVEVATARMARARHQPRVARRPACRRSRGCPAAP